MRETIRARQAEREELAQRELLIPWTQLAESPDQLAGKKMVLIRLTNAMNLHRAVWTFTPAEASSRADDAAARPVRVPQCWRGEQWIALAPGEWTATVAIGRPTGGRAIRLPIAPLAGRRGQVYELALTGEVEREVAALERVEARKHAEAAKHLLAPPESNKPGQNGAEPGGEQ
jgi:hypothetical protein